MSTPRILLLAGSVPSEKDVGGLILHDLIRLYPRDRICCFAIDEADHGSAKADLDWLPLHVENVPSSSGAQWSDGIRGRIVTHCRYRYRRAVYLPQLTRRVVEFGAAHRVELVWAVLNRPSLYRMAPAVAAQLGVPLVVTIWDPPESVCLNHRLDRFSRSVAQRDFDHAMRTAKRCAVMCEAMRDEYRARYGVETVIMRNGISLRYRRPVATRPNDDGHLTIGFCGALYATREWRALLSALASVNWRIDGRDVRVRAFTTSICGNLHSRACIEWLGWRPPAEVIELLSESDVNYLPYWFDPRRRSAVRLCFPAKLTTYLASGRPVFFHGPSDSSPTRFFNRFPVAACCHSLDEAEIVGTLERLVGDRALYERATAAIDAAIDEELNLNVSRARFAELIGVEEHELLPVTAVRPPRKRDRTDFRTGARRIGRSSTT